MAACVRSLAPLLLLLGLLSLLNASAKGDEVVVTFAMNQRTVFGRVFKIVGNSSELGNWNPGSVENMTWTPTDFWVVSVVLTKGVSYEYKAVGVDYDNGDKALCWMPGNNRVLKVPEKYADSNYVETVFWDALCGVDCSQHTVCGNSIPFRILKGV